MRWSELDLRKRVLSLPGTRTKNGRPHEVPLSRMAMAVIDIIDKLPRLNDELVFLPHSSSTLGSTHGKAMIKKALDEAGTPIADWRPHDLRNALPLYPTTPRLVAPAHQAESIAAKIDAAIASQPPAEPQRNC